MKKDNDGSRQSGVATALDESLWLLEGAGPPVPWMVDRQASGSGVPVADRPSGVEPVGASDGVLRHPGACEAELVVGQAGVQPIKTT